MIIKRTLPVLCLSLGLSLALALLWLLGGSGIARAAEYIVCPGGTPVIPPCQYGSIQSAVNDTMVVDGDIIHIRAGTYPEHVTVNKRLTFVGEGAGNTIVDGGGTGRVFNISDVDVSISDLTVQNGNVISTGIECPDSGCGGGIYAGGNLTLTNVSVLSNTAAYNGGGVHAHGNYVAAFVTLSDVLFQNNRSTAESGGGLYANHEATLTDVTFINNTAGYLGGGAYMEIHTVAHVTGGTFTDNQADWDGGGLYVNYPAEIIGTTFVHNYSGRYGGGFFVVGRGLTLTNASVLSSTAENGGGGGYANGRATLSGGLFQNNRTASSGAGGGLVVNGGGPLVLNGTQFLSNTGRSGGGGASADTAMLTGGLFQDNQCTESDCLGGGLRVSGEGTLALTGTQFLSNTAVGGGGGVYAVTTTLTGGLFQNNQCTDSICGGGGLYVKGGGGNNRVVNILFARNRAGSSGSGAALYLFDPLGPGGSADIIHNTIADPTTGARQAIYVPTGTVRITNTIVASYTVGIGAGSGATIVSDYNLFFNAPTSIITGAHSIVGADPRFRNPANDDYHLTVGSPAIDRGVNAGVSTDLDGNLRPQGNAPDIGAYEFPWYTLTVATTGNGSGVVTPTIGTHSYISGVTAWLTATANTGSTFVGWSGAVSGATNPISVTMDANKTVTATFTLNTYVITPTAGANGSITPGTPQTVNYGSSQAFTIAANTGYHIADVGADGVSVGAVSVYTFTNVTANHTITAAFAINTYVITPTAGANGSITPGTPQTVIYGGSQAFAIAADTGYHIADVGVDGSSVGVVSVYTFTNVTANHTITAAFAINTYVITPTAGANGSITPGTPQTVNYGGSQTFAIAADTGYHIADVGVDGSSVGVVSVYTFTNVTADHTLTATFTQNPPGTYSLIVQAAGAGSGTVTKNPNSPYYTAGTVVTLTAAADTGSTFAGWSGDVITTTTTVTLTMDANKTVTATFNLLPANYTLTINTAGNGRGSVTTNPSGSTFVAGTVVTLTAVPSSTSSFAGWSGDVSGLTNPITLTMGTDKTVTARFSTYMIYLPVVMKNQ